MKHHFYSRILHFSAPQSNMAIPVNEITLSSKCKKKICHKMIKVCNFLIFVVSVSNILCFPHIISADKLELRSYHVTTYLPKHDSFAQ